ncbi:hypothetical protein [Streptomyces ipomoeae]|uniref:Uncharacterized protein n=1 Tax=Streptomyces ipomoeae 91-03 TaxID=698759 RepID=L1KTH4_9ACTN|nr:hypothetical protein STRIP9103_04927 [Streptomyces ipomoeae 91-03]
MARAVNGDELRTRQAHRSDTPRAQLHAGYVLGKGAGYSDLEFAFLMEVISCPSPSRPAGLVREHLDAEKIASIPVLAARAARNDG